MELVREEWAAWRRERARWEAERRQWEAERRQLTEAQHALEQQHARQAAEHAAAVERLQSQLHAATSATAAAGVQPGPALLEFRDKHGLQHVESRNEEGWNLLHLAAVATRDTPGMLPIIEDLLRCLPAGHLAEETPAGKPEGFTPLHLLCQGTDPFLARTEAIPLLIAAKAPLEPRNRRGATPLLIAAGSAFVPAVRALVNCKADINAANEKGKTAWDLANAASKTLSMDIERMGGRPGNVEQAPPEVSRADARAGRQPPNRRRRQARRNADGADVSPRRSPSRRRAASPR